VGKQREKRAGEARPYLGGVKGVRVLVVYRSVRVVGSKTWKRIGSGVVAIVLALLMLILGGWYFTLAIGLLVVLGQLEYFRMVRAKGMLPAVKTTMLVSQVLVLMSYGKPGLTDAVLAVSGTLICFYLLFRSKFATIADLSASVMGLFYTGYLPSFWVRLRGLGQSAVSNLPLDGSWFFGSGHAFWVRLPEGLVVTLLAFGCIWAADIGAYVMGRMVGRTPLSEISPKKTWEGAFFGILGSVVVGMLGAKALGWGWVGISGGLFGLMIGVVSLLGDLTESLMKRDAGVKDSGDLIPGHGGILDRTDSYLFTAPLVFYFVTVLLPVFG
jgi:phosphatidate cytidylyltransferase